MFRLTNAWFFNKLFVPCNAMRYTMSCSCRSGMACLLYKSVHPNNSCTKQQSNTWGFWYWATDSHIHSATQMFNSIRKFRFDANTKKNEIFFFHFWYFDSERKICVISRVFVLFLCGKQLHVILTNQSTYKYTMYGKLIFVGNIWLQSTIRQLRQRIRHLNCVHFKPFWLKPNLFELEMMKWCFKSAFFSFFRIFCIIYFNYNCAQMVE